jgi:hypothetical protein
MLKKEEKERIKPGFVDPSKIAEEMDELMKCYGTDASKADLKETRKILAGPKVSSLHEELADMRKQQRENKYSHDDDDNDD